jgi:hypothetical protein
MGNRPVKEIRLGAIRASIWENGEENNVRQSVQIQKLYKKDDKWESTTNFNKADLPLVAKVADMAHSYIYGV